MRVAGGGPKGTKARGPDACLPCVWELSVLHNDLVSQAWDKGDWGAAGKSRCHRQQPGGFRHQQWCPAMSLPVTV